ncbi:hypothetical protein D9M71_145290 [compost metagenome]
MLRARVAGAGVDRQVRADARHQPRGIAAFGQADDGLDPAEVVGRVHGRQRDGFVDALEHLVHAVPGALCLRVAFGSGDDPYHGLDGFHWVGAGGGFCRQHDRIGAVEHRVGHVEYLGTGGQRLADHRFHHLRGGDYHTVQAAGAVDDQFLHSDQLGIADFHAEVATGHHYPFAGFDDAVEYRRVGDGLGALDLGDQPGFATGGMQ